MRGFKNFKGSDARCPSINFLFYGMDYQVGATVWLHNQQRKKEKLPKLSRNWDGQMLLQTKLVTVFLEFERAHRQSLKLYR